MNIYKKYKKIILGFMVAILVQINIIPHIFIIASASELQEETLIENMSVLEQAFVLNEITGKYTVDENLLKNAGFSDNEIEEFKIAIEEVNSIYFESNPKLRAYDWVANKYGNKVWKLPAWVIAVVAYLAGNVSDNIINRLIDWCIDGVTSGYKKFCNTYGNSNWATKTVCLNW